MTTNDKIFKISHSLKLDELPLGVMPVPHQKDYYFVSYSHIDYKLVFRDILLLQDEDINIWYDGGMSPGENWEEEAKSHIASFQCKGVIFYWSRNSLESNSVFKEIEYAKKYGKPFFSINIPSESISNTCCSAKSMIIHHQKNNSRELSEQEKIISDNFNENVLYLTYDCPLQKKVEAIKKLNKPELVRYEKNGKGLAKARVVGIEDSSVVSITIPERIMIDGELCTVVEIGSAAFANFKVLETVILPDSVTKIGDFAFFACASLKKILMNSVSDVGDSAFSGCSSLTIEQIKFKLGKNAFQNCTSIKNIKFCESHDVFSISQDAFSNCTELTTITFSSSIKYIGDGAFSGCKKLELVNIPSSVREIRDRAFYECVSLKKLQLKDGLYQIGISAFAKTSIEEIIIPDTVEMIGEEAFCSCHRLSNVHFSAQTKIIPSRCFMWSGLEQITIPNGVCEIQDEAFTRCDSLDYISLPDSVVRIWEDAFYRCPAKIDSKTYENPSIESLKSLTFEELEDLVHSLEDEMGVTIDSSKNNNLPKNKD